MPTRCPTTTCCPPATDGADQRVLQSPNFPYRGRFNRWALAFSCGCKRQYPVCECQLQSQDTRLCLCLFLRALRPTPAAHSGSIPLQAPAALPTRLWLSHDGTYGTSGCCVCFCSLCRRPQPRDKRRQTPQRLHQLTHPNPSLPTLNPSKSC